MIRWRGALVVGLAVVGASGEAEPITLGGLTFSDELGGVRLERAGAAARSTTPSCWSRRSPATVPRS